VIIETHAYARAGLLGNPSDGYFGKTISVSVRNFGAHVSLYETPELCIEAQQADRNVFRNINELVETVSMMGYYGAERLIKAAIRQFYDYCQEQNVRLPSRNFTVRYHSSIPRQIGLAGSSAIVTATMRALMQFYQVEIPPEILPTVILQAETRELKINAGLQDRVIQTWEGCVYMDFEKSYLEQHGHGRYERLDPALLPPLYIAYRTELGKVSGEVFNDLRTRYEKGEPLALATLQRLAQIAAEGREALLRRQTDKLDALVNENFDQRRKVMAISEANLALIQTARRCGASAAFAGSGGSIIGLYHGDEMLTRLIVELKKLKARVIRPYIV
jgi:glucuronokinase